MLRNMNLISKAMQKPQRREMIRLVSGTMLSTANNRHSMKTNSNNKDIDHLTGNKGQASYRHGTTSPTNTPESLQVSTVQTLVIAFPWGGCKKAMPVTHSGTNKP